MVQNPGFQFRRYCRTCGSDGLRGWRHGIRRAHKVTIDLAVRVQESKNRHNALAGTRKNLIVSETRDGFHACFGSSLVTDSETKNPGSSQPRPSKPLATRRQQRETHPNKFEQGRSPASFLFTGCRGHPCRRKRETHRGFHFQLSSRS